MNSIIVYNRDDLEKAQKNKIDEIVVVGELATQLKKSKTIATAGSISLGVLTVALGVASITAPVTGGLSFAVAAPIAVVSIGLTLVIAIFKDYEEVEAGTDKNLSFYIRFRKRQK